MGWAWIKGYSVNWGLKHDTNTIHQHELPALACFTVSFYLSQFGISFRLRASTFILILEQRLHRSQHQNKASAMAVLQSRLDQREMARQVQMNAQHTQSLTDITWGNQIRSYVLHVWSKTFPKLDRRSWLSIITPKVLTNSNLSSACSHTEW